MDPIVVAWGTALVSAMATDVWQRARASVVALWRRVHPQQADTVEADLEGLRAQVLDESLIPILKPPEQSRIGTLIMTGSSHGRSTFNQIAGNQYNIQLASARPSPATCTLLADTATFTERRKELHEITAAVTAAAEAGWRSTSASVLPRPPSSPPTWRIWMPSNSSSLAVIRSRMAVMRAP